MSSLSRFFVFVFDAFFVEKKARLETSRRSNLRKRVCFSR